MAAAPETTLPLYGASGVSEALDLKNPARVEAFPLPAEVHEKIAERSEFEIEEHPIDQLRDLKVGVIGAGLSGISAGVLLPAKLPGLDLRIYDKNPEAGGTWYENTYPGVRCDIPAHAYQSGFEPNTQWSEEFAQGAELCNYWQGLAKKYDVYKYLRFQQKVTKAEWLPEEAKWKLTVQDLAAGKTYEDKLDFVVSAAGHFNAWQLPKYPGIETYKGNLFHSSNWQHGVDLKDKNIALIGNGASGLQVLPSIQPIAKRVDHYARNKTWIVQSFGPIGVRRLEANLFTKEQLESFKDSKKYLEFRKTIESGFFDRFQGILKNTPEHESYREKWIDLMMSRITEKPELADKIIPDFPPNCRRPTPGPGYLEAISKPNVDFIQTRIDHFTETGIVTTDGVQRDVDVVICSTGANVDFAPHFPIVANGIDLQSAWKPGGLYGYPHLYLGMTAPEFPNIAWIGGPYAAGYGGTVPNSIENQVTYVAKMLRKIRSQAIKTMAPSKEATADFIEYCDKFFPRTVWTANDGTENKKNCSSWYNGGVPGGRIFGVFPGSGTHGNFARRDPRWEDYEYTRMNGNGNRFAYFGNGMASRETVNGSDRTPHLKLPEDTDLKSWCEGWWDV